MSVSAGESQFWEVAAPLQSSPAVARSTVMGLPCLRVNGQFVASFDRRTGDLVVKLAEERVHELIERGQAHPFAPSGRRLREWAAISSDRPEQRRALLGEAVAFVGGTET
jgi:hypothetical protein